MTGEEALLAHLQKLTGFSPSLLRKILDEVRVWYGDDPADWARRRHQELQRSGLRNDAIYSRLQTELSQAVFSPGPRSKRQVRRMIYG